ncbi:MAG: ABC transporter substrate-binding protein, partial [Pseudonocardiaceae bacterium]|nr:ABC transporter substrate-binding protein [Pseudonocardiaceae bacterium]
QKMVPEPVAGDGTLVVATSSNLPPMTYVAEDGDTLVGFDIDMAKAVSAVLGLEADVRTAGFDALIPGLQADRYEIAMSSMGVTEERQRVVDFVSYYNGGQGFLASAASDFKVAELADLCGLRVAVQSGSTQQSTLEKESGLCAAAGQDAWELQVFPNNNAAVLAIQGDRVDVLYASISIVGYTAEQSPEFRVAGRYSRAVVGAALPKDSGLTEPVRAAVQTLIDDGTYTELLAKWGLQDNGVKTAEINNAEPGS